MKALVGWLSDPYVHLFVVGLILVRLSMGVGPEDARAELASASASPSARCASCAEAHGPAASCLPVVARSSVHADAE